MAVFQPRCRLLLASCDSISNLQKRRRYIFPHLLGGKVGIDFTPYDLSFPKGQPDGVVASFVKEKMGQVLAEIA